jgi:hypothetical protein
MIAVGATIRILLVGGVALCVLLLLGNCFRWWSELSESRLPAREKLLRSPGESMRRNLEQLNEYLIYSVALFLLVPMAFAWKTPNLTTVWPVLFLVCLMAVCAIPGVCVVRLYRSYAFGLRAERAVGEELNQLMLDGCPVFHDYPAAPDWHINHIVVAPSGVYAIETKSGPRRRADASHHESYVTYDGAVLKFPHYSSSKAVEQARRSGEILRHQLSHALGTSIEVKSVLTVPCWKIKRQGSSDVQVLNPQEIWNAIVTTAAPHFSEIEVQQIARCIHQKCRDVEI